MQYNADDEHNKQTTNFNLTLLYRQDQIVWLQMLAECHRRVGQFESALKVFSLASSLHPRDTSCLKAMIQLSKELGLNYSSYQKKLDRVLKLTNPAVQ